MPKTNNRRHKTVTDASQLKGEDAAQLRASVLPVAIHYTDDDGP